MAEETKVEEVKKENVAENTDEIRSMDDISSEIDASFENFRDADAEGWDKCKTYMEEGTVLDLTVDGIATKGGVIVNIEGIRGFVPASHLSLKRIDDLNDYLGKAVQLQVIEVDELQKRLILSARKLLQNKAAAEKAAQVRSIEVGSIVECEVETLKPYGAFVKLENGVSGLIHVSQISIKRIQEPANVLKEGQKVQAKVLSTKDGKLSLSMRAIEEDAQAKKEAEERNVEIPEAESIGQSMGALLKGFKFD